MDHATQLGEARIPRLLLKFSTPAIVGMMAQALYNVVDRIFVGQAVGPLGIAGTTVSFPFMLILLALSMLIGFGATALVSIRLGEQRHDEAETILGNATVLLVVITLVMTVIGMVFLRPLLIVFGASEQIYPYARDYLQIIICGSVFQSIGFGLNALIRAEGNPRIAMFTMLIGALLNTIGDPIFLFGFGWGMRGAALSTILSQAVSAVWVLGYFRSGNSLLRLKASRMRLQWPICKSMIAVGSPPFARQIAYSVLNAILNNQLLVFGGDMAISVMGIVYAVLYLFAMPIFGINQGAQPIIGYNHGAEKFDRVKKTLMLAILAASCVSTAGFVLAMFFPGAVIRVFSRDTALLDMGPHALRICLAMFPIIGFQIVGANYFQAVGKPKQALFLSLSRQVILLIPAVLILPHFFRLDGVWWAFPIADVGSCLLTGTWLIFELRHLDRRHAETTEAEPQPVVFLD